MSDHWTCCVVSINVWAGYCSCIEKRGGHLTASVIYCCTVFCGCHKVTRNFGSCKNSNCLLLWAYFDFWWMKQLCIVLVRVLPGSAFEKDFQYTGCTGSLGLPYQLNHQQQKGFAVRLSVVWQVKHQLTLLCWVGYRSSGILHRKWPVSRLGLPHWLFIYPGKESESHYLILSTLDISY